MNRSLSENSEAEFFESITIYEFDRRFRAAWLHQFMMIALVMLGITLIPAAMILYANQFIWLTVLTVAVIPVLVIFLFYFYEYIIRHFKLSCPYCKKSLQREFDGFKSYIRTKGQLYSNNNPFVDGRCFYCKNVIIDVDERLNSHLQKRNILFKKNSKPIVSTVCLIVGFIFFAVTLGDNNETRGNNIQEPKNIDIYLAKRKIEAGNFTEAKKILASIHAKQPHYSTVNELLGYIYLQEDELEKSLHYYQEAISYSANTKEIQNAILLIKGRLKDNQ